MPVGRGARGVGRENAGGHSVQPGFPLLPEGGGPFRSQRPGVCRKTAQSALGQVDSSTLVNDSTPIRRKLLHVRDLSAPKSRRLTSMKVSTWLRGNCDSPRESQQKNRRKSLSCKSLRQELSSPSISGNPENVPKRTKLAPRGAGKHCIRRGAWQRQPTPTPDAMSV